MGYLVLWDVLVWVIRRRSLLQGELAKFIGLVIDEALLYLGSRE